MTEIFLKPETLELLRKKAKGCVYCRKIFEAMKGNQLQPWSLGPEDVIDVETQKGHLLLEIGSGR